MPIDFSTLVYAHCYDVFARPVTITPTKSQPGQPAYTGRGIYSTQPLDVLTENGAIFSDQVTILDLLEREFTVVPRQGDLVDVSSFGQHEIIEVVTNGGGETTCTIRKIMTAKP